MQPIHVPHEHVNDDSVLLLEWLVEDGQQVAPGDLLATMETSKATFEMEAPAAGYVRLNQTKDTEVKVGEVLCYIAESADEPLPATASGNGSQLEKEEMPFDSAVRFSRKARELMEQHRLAEEQFAGQGLVRASDVRKAAGLDGGGGESAPQPPAESAGVSFRAEPLPRRKRMEAKYLGAGQNALGSMVSVICSTRGLKAAARRHPELGGGPLPLIIHETALLLRKYPIFNACYHDGEVHYFQQINVGFALDADLGLKVPVIAGADEKTIGQIRVEVEDMVDHYLMDTLSLEALEAGTFTISDLSGEEVHSFAPLVNQGQAAILGIGAEYFPVGSEEGIFNLMLAFDHRLAEGRVAAGFLTDLKERIESYERALRGGDDEAAGIEEPSCSRCLRPASDLRKINVPLLQQLGPTGETSPICFNCVQGY